MNVSDALEALRGDTMIDDEAYARTVARKRARGARMESFIKVDGLEDSAQTGLGRHAVRKLEQVFEPMEVFVTSVLKLEAIAHTTTYRE